MPRNVLVTGAETITGYNTARSINSSNYRIYGLVTNTMSWTSVSGIWSELFTVNQYESSIIEELIDIGKILFEKNNKKTLLLPTQDYLVEKIALNRVVLSKYYRFMLPDLDVVERLLDKTLFYKWALEEGFLLPRSSIATDSQELSQTLKKSNYPVIIKPLYRSEKWDLINQNAKCLYLNCYDEIHTYPHDLFSICDRYIVQEWISGGDDDVYFCLVYINENYEVVASFTGKKLLQWPLNNGSTSICISYEDERIREITVDLLTSSGMIGLGSLEFKYNRNNDQYYIIEPTVGRNDHQSYIATASGVNLTGMFVDDLVDTDTNKKYKSKNAIWIDEMAAARGLYQSKKYKLLVKVIISCICYKKSFAIFNLSDIKPFRELCKHLIKKAKFKLQRSIYTNT